MTNKDRAIQSLDSFKPRSLGGGIRTASLESIAAQKNGTVMKFDPIVKNFSEEEWKKQSRKQLWLIGGLVTGLIVLTVVLLKLKVIKL